MTETQAETRPRLVMRPGLHVREEPDPESNPVPIEIRRYQPIHVTRAVHFEDGFDWILVHTGDRQGWIEEEFTIFQSVIDARGALEIGSEPVDRYHSLPPDYCPADLVELPGRVIALKDSILLRREAAGAFVKLVAAAEKDGLTIRVFSGYRDPEYQLGLYLRQIEQDGPKQAYVARPCHSEHQLGTAADLVGENVDLAAEPEFQFTREAFWIQNNCRKFGMRLSYTKENRHETGYMPEPWHLRYTGGM